MAEPVGEGDRLELEESEAVTEGEAPEDREAVALGVAELLLLGSTEGEPLLVPLTVALWLDVLLLLPVPGGELLGLAPLLRVEAADGLWLELWLRELEAEGALLPLPVGDPDTVELPVEDAVLLPVPVVVELLLPVAVPEAL